MALNIAVRREEDTSNKVETVTCCNSYIEQGRVENTWGI